MGKQSDHFSFFLRHGSSVRNLLTFAFVLTALLLIPTLSHAQDTAEQPEARPLEAPEVNLEGLTMEAHACLGNLVRQGAYFPVKITLENNGPSRRGELRIVSEDVTHPFTATFKAECDIPTNSRKSFYIYPYILENDSSPALYIQYVEKGLPLATQVIELDFLKDDEKLWVEVSDEGADFVFLSGITLPDGASFSDIAVLVTEEQARNPYGGGMNPYMSGATNPPNNLRYEPVTPAMVWVRPQNLPDHVEGYEGVDGIIMNTHRWDALTLEQRKALAEYIISGGAMVIWLAEDEKRYQGSFLTGAFDGSGVAGPYALTQPTVRTTLTSLRSIPGFSGNRQILGDFPCTYATDPSARTLFSEGDVPILQQISFGRGDILLSGLDLKALKSASSEIGLSAYADFLIGYLMSLDDRMKPLNKTRQDYTGYPGYYNRNAVANPFVDRSEYCAFYDFNNSLQSDKLTALPHLGAIAYFLLFYIVIVGPVNYYVLYKMRRREWLWYTIPIIVTCFVLFTYSWALKTKGNRLMLTRVNVLDVFPDETAGWQSSYFSLFSPMGKRYDVEVESENLIRALETPTPNAQYMDPGSQTGDVLTLVHHGRSGNAFVDAAYIKIWTEQHFETNGAVYNSGSVRLENVTLQNHQLSGNLIADLGYGLESPFLFYYIHGGFTSVKVDVEGGIFRNGSVPFDINFDSRVQALPAGVTQNTAKSDRAAKLRTSALKALNARAFKYSGEDEIILAGWLSGDAPLAMTRPRVRSVTEETLVLVHIPATIELGEAPVEGVRSSIIGMQAAKTEISSQTGNLLLTDGSMQYALTFPSTGSSISMPGSLRINIATSQDESAPLNVSVFNHSTARWDVFTGLGSTATAFILRIGDLGSYLSPDRRVMLLKIEGDKDATGEVIALGGVTINAT